MEHNSQLISVIVPVYNVEPYLDRCIESIVNQTYRNLEIILIDDGSPDHCPTMCDAWAEKDNRIKVIHKENGGLSDARNAGLDVATGAYIAFVDSDDWIDINFYDILVNCITENCCDIAECGFTMTSGVVDIPESSGKITLCTSEEAMEWHIHDKMFQQVVWNKLYRRQVISTKFEKRKYHEDEFWTYQIISNCERLAHIDRRMYFYFQRQDSIMGEGYSLKRLDALEAKYRRYLHLKEFYPALSDQCAVDVFFACMYHGQLALTNLNPDQVKQSFSILNEISKQCYISKPQQRKLRITHRLWLQSAKINLSLTCRLRNLLKIGL